MNKGKAKSAKNKNKKRGMEVTEVKDTPRILMTGGTGLLGREILKLDAGIIALPRSELDITDRASISRALDRYRPATLLHLAAKTKPPEHEKDPGPGIEINIIGTAYLAAECLRRRIRLVYTSSDYLYTGSGPHGENDPLLPPSKFIWSKLGGEAAVALLPNSLILRLSFGPVPYPWEKVYAGQYTSKLYVDEIAPIVLAAARSGATGIMNIGGPRSSLEDYARRTRPGIETIPKPDFVPEDTSFSLAKMRTVLGIGNPYSLYRHRSRRGKSRKA